MEEKLWKDHCALLNKDEENELEIFGYKTQSCRKALCIAGSILSCGALLLLFYWKPEWDVWANCIRCSLEEADIVLLRTTDEFHRYTRKKVTWIDLSGWALPAGSNSDGPFVADKDCVINRAIMKPQLKMRCIQVQKIRYIWDFSVKEFRKVGSLEDRNTCHSIHHKFGAGLTREERKIRQLVCGPNAIEVEIRPIWKLLFKEILNPFYVFQAFTLTLWLSQGYVEYSVAIIILSIISVGLTVYDLRQQSTKLHDLVEEHNKVKVTVCTKSEGFNTAKGDLVRSILYPKPVNFKLYRDAFKFIIGLSVIGVFGLIYTVCVFVSHKKPVTDVVAMALLLLTVAVPPTIPAALTTGTVYAQRRLKKKKIFCISPQRINICGQINLVCFDKAPVEGIAILHQFPFSSGLQRMSVVSQKIGEEQYDLYMKGAPEIVSSFCRRDTVPANFLKELKTYTSQGFRVIALAHKVLNLGKDVDVSNLEREEAESGLVFLGLLVMENRLKQETMPVLRELAAARIRSVMVTVSLTEAYPKLAPYRPPGQLLSPPLLLSVTLNVFFTIIMQTCGFLLVKQQPWYVVLASQRHCSPGNQTVSPTSPEGNGSSSSAQITVLSYEDTTLWPLSSINCIIVAFVFSKGKPFRKPIYTNYVFSALLALQLAICLFLFFADIDAVYSGMQDVILQNKHLWLLIKAWFGYQSKSQYRKWQRMLQRDPSWPPINTKDFAAKSTDEIYINPTYEHSEGD
ncbi:probable cation-transporting ATPase 13A5 [Grus japonensis]|uniref:Cation-transporting ATPase n=1 Tax=Grus japonensis TaxID=30415 RepID=A0ABC9X7B8_GRUJA